MRITSKTIMIIMILLSIVDCKPKEPKKPVDKKYAWAYRKGAYEYTKIPGKFLGINFCKITLIDVIAKLKKIKVKFRCYDGATGEEFKYSGSKADIYKLGSVESSYFIGSGLDQKNIIKVSYDDSTQEEWFHFTIEFHEKYYNELLHKLGKILGTKTVNYNDLDYNETSWDADPDGAVPTCISSVVISRRLRYDDIKKENDGIAYLQIETRPRNGHVP